MLVEDTLEVRDWPGVYALGDCALIPDRTTGKYCPPTAQHALREGKVTARNLVASIRGGKKMSFSFMTIGQLAAIGRRTGVAEIFGWKFSGFLAWWMWRSIYLSKLPRQKKKLRVRSMDVGRLVLEGLGPVCQRAWKASCVASGPGAGAFGNTKADGGLIVITGS